MGEKCLKRKYKRENYIQHRKIVIRVSSLSLQTKNHVDKASWHFDRVQLWRFGGEKTFHVCKYYVSLMFLSNTYKNNYIF